MLQNQLGKVSQVGRLADWCLIGSSLFIRLRGFIIIACPSSRPALSATLQEVEMPSSPWTLLVLSLSATATGWVGGGGVNDKQGQRW